MILAVDFQNFVEIGFSLTDVISKVNRLCSGRSFIKVNRLCGDRSISKVNKLSGGRSIGKVNRLGGGRYSRWRLHMHGNTLD